MSGEVEDRLKPSLNRRSNVFILSDTRSGSTLLDQCLGAHPDVVSLGEVHWLRAYVREDRTIYDPVHPLVCSCGETVVRCPFWSLVRDAIGRPLDSLELHLEGRNRLARLYPGCFRWRVARRLVGGETVASDTIALLDAVQSVSGCSHCVDSSKSAIRFRSVFERSPRRSLAIVLTRDYRAVVHSKMKRGMDLETAAMGWKRKMHQIEVLTSDLPTGVVSRVKYEDLCEDPRHVLAEICGFIGIEFADAMLRRTIGVSHHIGGSPSKFDEARVSISLDRSYLEQFDVKELARLKGIVGDTAERWGY